MKQLQSMQNQLMGCCESVSSHLATIATRGPITIYYGTTSGNSSRLAYQLAQELQMKSFIPSVINLGEFDPEVFYAQRLVAFVVASYGTGGPTADAEEFHNWLQSQTSLPPGIKYFVFGLGNKNYENFCGMGVKTDAKLEELGAQRVYPLGKGDAQNETTEKDWESWKAQGLFECLETICPIREISETQLMESLSQFVLEYVKPTTPTTLNKNDYQHQYQEYMKSPECPIVSIKELKQNASETNSTLLVDIDVKQLNGYPTAGNLNVYVENDQTSVEKVAHICGWDLDASFTLKSNPTQKQVFKLPFPTPITVREYLTKFADIHGKVSKSQFYELSKFCPARQKEMVFLSSFDGREKFEENILDKNHSFLTILEEYNIENLPLLKGIEIIQPLRPRIYTIASSSKKHPNNIHLMVSALTLKQNDKVRPGVASDFFRRLHKKQDQSTLRVSLVESIFKFPVNPQGPIILVGTGAGVAPMRALIQEKDQYIEDNKLEESPLQGAMELYFGCRSEAEFILKNEFAELLDMGTLSSLNVAFSQEKEKVYVTNLLSQDLTKLATFFLDLGGTMYICGSAKMGKDVSNVIEQMFKTVKKTPPYMAYKKVAELSQKKQIMKEVWG